MLSSWKLIRQGGNLEEWQAEVSEEIGKRAGRSGLLRSDWSASGRTLTSKLSRVLELSLGSALGRRLDKLLTNRSLGGGEGEVRQAVNIDLVGSLLSLPGHVHTLLGGDELDELVTVLTDDDGPEG